jgi:hypothetical protein
MEVRTQESDESEEESAVLLQRKWEVRRSMETTSPKSRRSMDFTSPQTSKVMLFCVVLSFLRTTPKH